MGFRNACDNYIKIFCALMHTTNIYWQLIQFTYLGTLFEISNLKSHEIIFTEITLIFLEYYLYQTNTHNWDTQYQFLWVPICKEYQQ